MHLALWKAAGRKSFEPARTFAVQDRFGQDRTRRIAGAKEQDVEHLGHAAPIDYGRTCRCFTHFPFPVQGCHKSWQRRNRRCRSEEHTSELQSPMRNSYAVFGMKTTTILNITNDKRD